MRIALIIDGLPGGGAEAVVIALSGAFIRKGHVVTVFNLRAVCDVTLPEGLDYQVINDQYVTAWQKLMSISCRAKQLDAAIREAERRNGAYDLVLSHLHKTDRIVRQCPSLATRNVWYCLHGMFSRTYLENRSLFSRWLKQWKIKKTYKGGQLITVSDAVADDLTYACGVTPAVQRTHYNPFDFAAIRNASESPCDRPAGQYLIHVGRFHEVKRHDRLICAYAVSGIQAPLVLLGKGCSEATQRIRQYAIDHQVADRVIFAGHQPNPYPWIRHASLLVISSDSEGLGNVAVEALALGTPVVSTDCPGGIREILHGELRQYLCPVNSLALGYMLRDVYQHPYSVPTNHLDKFDIDRVVEDYLACGKMRTNVL